MPTCALIGILSVPSVLIVTPVNPPVASILILSCMLLFVALALSALSVPLPLFKKTDFVLFPPVTGVAVKLSFKASIQCFVKGSYMIKTLPSPPSPFLSSAPI